MEASNSFQRTKQVSQQFIFLLARIPFCIQRKICFIWSICNGLLNIKVNVIAVSGKYKKKYFDF